MIRYFGDSIVVIPAHCAARFGIKSCCGVMAFGVGVTLTCFWLGPVHLVSGSRLGLKFTTCSEIC